MTDRPVLEKLMEDGWEFKTSFADLQVYGKADDRVVYDPKTDRIHDKYKYSGVASPDLQEKNPAADR